MKDRGVCCTNCGLHLQRDTMVLNCPRCNNKINFYSCDGNCRKCTNK